MLPATERERDPGRERNQTRSKPMHTLLPIALDRGNPHVPSMLPATERETLIEREPDPKQADAHPLVPC